jgi:hypothetical protein
MRLRIRLGELRTIVKEELRSSSFTERSIGQQFLEMSDGDATIINGHHVLKFGEDEFDVDGEDFNFDSAVKAVSRASAPDEPAPSLTAPAFSTRPPNWGALERQRSGYAPYDRLRNPGRR